jgi:hypothetical protein
MIDLMGNAPYDYIMSHTDKNLEQLKLCASNFNGHFAHFIKSLKHIYLNHNGLEAAFAKSRI